MEEQMESAESHPEEEESHSVDTENSVDDETKPAPPPSEVELLKLELETKRQRINELAKGVQDLKQDFDVRVKRIERENERAVDLAKGQLLEKLVPVLDQFQISLDAVPPSEANQGVLEGIQLIYKQFLGQLDDLGLTQFNPMGAPFDPSAHEALGMLPVPNEDQNGRVIQVVRHGYRFQSRILRPAQVLVGNCPVSEPKEEAAESETSDAEPEPSVN